MSKYILSTMTSPVGYAFWETVDGVPIQRKKIIIYGAKGIPSERSGFGEMGTGTNGQPIWTADGFITTIDDADYEALKEHKVFIKHVEAGLVKCILRDLSQNHKELSKYASEMSTDGFSVLNKSTIGQKIKVTSDVAKTEDEFRI